MEPNLVEQVRTALVVVRTSSGKQIARVCGRTCFTLAHVEQAALLEGMTLEDFALLESQTAPTTPENQPLEGTNTDEATLLLTPGVSLFVHDGGFDANGPSGHRITPGDFKLFLEGGGDAYPGQVRELLVGKFREFDDQNDHEHPEGNFLDDSAWDALVSPLEKQIIVLSEQIGILAFVEQPDEQKPRGESWLAERANAEIEIAELKDQLAAVQSEIAAAHVLPENALELIQKAGISKVKAEVLLKELKELSQEQA